MKRNKSWTRRNELLAILPAAQPLMPPPRLGVWADVLRALSREWRVFSAYGPKPGLNLPVGGKGVDPLPFDTLTAMRRVLAEQLVSGVLLVGPADMLESIETLHSFAPHVPFVAALTGPGRMKPERLEFELGWLDLALFEKADFKKRLEPALKRLGVPSELAPGAGRAAEHKEFAQRLSRLIQGAFLRINRRAIPKAEECVDWIGFLKATSQARWNDALSEWAACLPRKGGTLLIPRAAGPQWRGRILRRWPKASVISYRDQEHAIERANRALAAARRPRSLLVSDSARLSPVCADRLVQASHQHPLSAVVCPEAFVRSTEDFRQWSAFSHAWQMRLSGGCRAVSELFPHCLMLNREAVDKAGLLDPRLGWYFGVQDLALRVRQNGWALFKAEDAAVSFISQPGQADDDHERFKESFLRKWTLDPWAVLNGRGSGSKP